VPVPVVLFCPVTFNLAETTRMIEVARALGPGVEPVFLGYEEDFAHLVVEAGFEYVQGAPVLTADQRDQLMKVDQGRSLRTPLTYDVVAARVLTERALIRERGAGAVVIGSNVTSLLSARAERVPLFFPVPFALSVPHVTQTVRLGLIGGTGRSARAADTIASAAMRLAYTRLPLAPRAFRKVAREIGVPPIRMLSELLEADHNLLTVLPSEVAGYELPPGYEVVGPIFAQLDAPVPDIVTELAAAAEPLVYLGLGSSASRRLALAAARSLGDLRVNVVAPIAHYVNPGDDLPSNVHVTDLLPAHRLGGLVDAAVLHGGQGTVQTACATGVPFVGMGLQPEQTWNVAVCARWGNAIAVRPQDAATPRLAQAVRRLLDDPGHRAAAERVRQDFAHADGAAAAARIIREHLQRAAPADC